MSWLSNFLTWNMLFSFTICYYMPIVFSVIISYGKLSEEQTVGEDYKVFN